MRRAAVRARSTPMPHGADRDARGHDSDAIAQGEQFGKYELTIRTAFCGRVRLKPDTTGVWTPSPDTTWG